ncbi:MAG: hypothetical protein OEX19_11525 [Gammaproteobacteria bacterium]|nr:hypothetical protein [Gammaproteobacteria bacterium]
MDGRSEVNNKKFYAIISAIIIIVLVIFLFTPNTIKISKTCPDGRVVNVSASDGFLLRFLSNAVTITVKSSSGESGALEVKEQKTFEIDELDKRRDFLLKTEMLKILNDSC